MCGVCLFVFVREFVCCLMRMCVLCLMYCVMLSGLSCVCFVDGCCPVFFFLIVQWFCCDCVCLCLFNTVACFVRSLMCDVEGCGCVCFFCVFACVWVFCFLVNVCCVLCLQTY